MPTAAMLSGIFFTVAVSTKALFSATSATSDAVTML
jgi:hypothetical protein